MKTNVDQYVCSECNENKIMKNKSNSKINYDLSKNIIKWTKQRLLLKQTILLQVNKTICLKWATFNRWKSYSRFCITHGYLTIEVKVSFREQNKIYLYVNVFFESNSFVINSGAINNRKKSSTLTQALAQ